MRIFVVPISLVISSLWALGLAPAQVIHSKACQTTGVEVAWITQYVDADSGSDEPTGIAVDQSGNVYVCAKDDISGRLGDDFDMAILKFTLGGDVQWVSHYRTPGSDQPRTIQLDNAGNVYIHGTSEQSNYDYALVKFNASGVQQWGRGYDGPSQSADFGTGMVIDASGNIYVTGSSMGEDYPVVGPDYDIATIKYNAQAEKQWIARYDGSSRGSTVSIISDDAGQYIAVDNDGNVFVAGTSGNNIVMIKYNAQGVQQWVNTYSGPGYSDDRPVGLAVDAEGNVYCAGTTEGYGAGMDIFAAKFNPAGVQQWFAGYESPADDEAEAMSLDASGSLYVCGTSDHRIVTIKYTRDGEKAWSSLHDTVGSYGSYGKGIVVDQRGNVYVLGYSMMATTWYDFVTICYDASGSQQWIAQYDNNGGFELLCGIAVDAQGDVIVTGKEVMLGWYRITTIKYSQIPLSVEERRASPPSSFRLSQNYPNPFNPTTSIGYSVGVVGLLAGQAGGQSSVVSSHVRLAVYDLLGREVAVLVNENQAPGSYQVRFAANGLPTGTYFYRLQTNTYQSTKTMTVVR